MFDQWRIVFERSKGSALVHAAEGEDHDSGIPEGGWRYCDVARRCSPEDGWRYCHVAGECKDDDTLRVTG